MISIEDIAQTPPPPLLDEKDLKIIQLQDENSWLKEQIKSLNRLVFGPKKIKFIPDGDGILYLPGMDPENSPKNEPPAEEEKAPGKTGKKKPSTRSGNHSLQIPEDCPVETIIQDLSEEEKINPETGERLVKIGEEITRKLAYRAGSYFVQEVIRYKYASPSREEAGIIISELPDSILPKSRADESLLAEIVTKKYGDHLPLYRISEIFSRDGVQISRQLLSQWIIQLGFVLTPLYNLMWKLILDSGNCFIDETPVKLQVKGKGKLQTGYMWILVGGKSSDPPYRIYRFFKDRCHAHALEMVEGYSGLLHSDKLEVYHKLGRRPGIIWCPCLEHAKRKFLEAESGDLPFRDWIIAKLRFLDHLEEQAWEMDEVERLAFRKEKAEPIVDEIIKAINERKENGFVLPKSKFKEALYYIYGLLPYLKNYLYHANARINNNIAERAARPIAIGRKNWLFVGSENGGEASATLFSLVQTCRGLDINPREYLEDVMRRMPGHPINRLQELLPDQWALARGLTLKMKPLHDR